MAKINDQNQAKMKTKTKLIILLAFVFNFGTLFAETIGISTIYTKGGKAVEVILRTDISDKLRYIYDAEIQKRFPNATLLNSATTTYNCHSYAWNLSDGGNTVCWINDSTADKKPNVANYWNDGYYYETTEANAKKSITSCLTILPLFLPQCRECMSRNGVREHSCATLQTMALTLI